MRLPIVLLALLLPVAACTQTHESPAGALRPAPYPCDGCEITHEADPDTLGWQATVAAADEPGERLVLTGRVVGPDGRTPMPEVVLYVHQTDATGRYRHEDSRLALQGWLRTDAEGRYRVETIRPGPYPSGGMPAHIHVYVAEPGRAAYYLNDFVFEGDPELTPTYRATLLPGPDDGVLRLTRDGDGWLGIRDLRLVR